MEGKKVLVVDDEPDIATTLSDYFKSENYAVEVAANGEEGIAKAKTFKPDIILLDVLMPVMDGITALKKLKADPDTAGIQVVMLTNLDNQDKVASAMESGTMHYLIKSDYAPDDLKKKVDEILSGYYQ